MSLSFGSSKKKTKSSEEQDPWTPTIEPLEDLIGDISAYQDSSTAGATAGQQEAFNALVQNAQSEGNPFADQIKTLTSDLFNTTSRSPEVEAAYGDLQGRLGGIADGANLNVNENPYIQEFLQNNMDSIQQRINAQFAGAGRDLSGKNQQSLSRGISEGTIPTLFNQYNLERANQADAAKTLFSGGVNTAQTAQGLDQAALGDRLKGITSADAYTAARDYGPNTILALEQQMKQLPLEDLGRIEALLGPLAQLGGQRYGKSTTKGSSSGFGLDGGSLFSGLGTLLSGSDERLKEGVDGPGSEPDVVGELADGTPIHRYRYKGGGPVQLGVMAQEVKQDNPDAVRNEPMLGGMMAVDYEAATDKSADMMKNGGNAVGVPPEDDAEGHLKRLIEKFMAGMTAHRQELPR